MRVYELAKELNVSTKALRQLMKKRFGLGYPSHMSGVEDSDVAKVREYYSKREGKLTEINNEKNASPSLKKDEIKAGAKSKADGPLKNPVPPAHSSPKKKIQASSHPSAPLKRPKPLKEELEEEGAQHKKTRKPHINADAGEEDLPKKKHFERKSRHRQENFDEDAEEGQEKGTKAKKPFANKTNKNTNKSKVRNKPQPAKAKEEAPDDDFNAIVEIPEEITVGDFARAIHKNAMDVITALIKLGVMAGLNESITFETAEKVAEAFGVLIMKPEKKNSDEIFDRLDYEDNPRDLKARPPVVTVMGHVDHGKTSLLDKIRETSVTRGEAGGITQHIGASVARIEGKTITFIDTPGHKAFTEMRARGAEITDIVILVVAADDGVMPQTIEAINHAKAAQVPIVVAINKIDRYGANPERVMQELMEYGLVPEQYGGDTIMVPVSAKTGEGIEDLLANVLILAEVLELKANPKRPAVGVVIESQLEKGMGPTASIVVQKGTLTNDDYIVSGYVSGHIRVMFDARGKQIKKAGPSTPVKITGLTDLPEAGDKIYAVKDEKIARDFAAQAGERAREQKLNSTTHVSLDDLHMKISEGGLKELNLIVKTDVQGTIDALAGSLKKLGNEEVKVNIIHAAVGGISESDVMLAEASDAIIIGFNVRPNQGALAQAKRSSIDIRTYRVIYEAIEDIENAIAGMLEPEIEEEVLGRADIQDTFKVPNVGTVAGIYVTSGKMVRSAKVRLIRNDIVIHEGAISSLKRYKDDVREVLKGYEGGLGIENYNDVKVGDIIECYHEIEVQAKSSGQTS